MKKLFVKSGLFADNSFVDSAVNKFHVAKRNLTRISSQARCDNHTDGTYFCEIERTNNFCLL